MDEVQGAIQANSGNLDPVNVSTALQQLEQAYSIVPPKGENYMAARHLFLDLLRLAHQLIPHFKIDALTMTVSAMAKLAAHGRRIPFFEISCQEEKLFKVLLVQHHVCL